MMDLKIALNAISKKDYNTTFKILSPLAENKNPSALFYLGYFYHLGLGVTANKLEAERLRSNAIKIIKINDL